ncbi:MAG: hypothetical protein ACYC63_05440 [Armatimonadota bacterium]
MRRLCWLFVPYLLTWSCLSPAGADGPQARVGDYVVHVLRASASVNRDRDLQWGIAPPGLLRKTDAVGFELQVEARSPLAALRLRGGGVYPVKCIWDDGTVAAVQPSMGGGPQSASPSPLASAIYVTMPRQWVRFMAAPDGQRKRARLEGALRVWPELRVYQVALAPGHLGKTVRQDDLSVTVEKWTRSGDHLAVVVSLASPALAKLDPRQLTLGFTPHAQLTGVPRLRSYPMAQSIDAMPGGVRIAYSFIGVPTADGMNLAIETFGRESKTLPFVLRDLPVPAVGVPDTAPPIPSVAAPEAHTLWPTRSAAWLGDQLLTLDFRGKLRDAIKELERLGQVTIFGPFRQFGPVRYAEDLPVRLDLQAASPHVALLSLCRQAGLVYEVTPDTGYVFLRQGDRRLDSRPAVQLGDYRLRVRRLYHSWQQTQALSDAAPPDTNPSERFSLSLDVEARSQAAALRFAGIDPALHATFDTGPSFEVGVEGYKGSRFKYVSCFRIPYERALSTVSTASLRLPCPPAGARAIKRLEGRVWLYPQASQYVLLIPADSEGQTFRQGDVSVVVSKWQSLAGAVRIDLRLNFADAGDTGPWNQDRDALRARLYDKDGQPLDARQSGQTERKDCVHYEFVYSQGASPADHLELQITRRPPADRTVPFVLEDVPLP